MVKEITPTKAHDFDFSQSPEQAKEPVKEKVPAAKRKGTETAIFNACKAVFLEHATGYYFEGKDAKALKLLIGKIRATIDTQVDGSGTIPSFRLFVENLPKYWRTKKFTLPLLNSNFNEILNEIHTTNGTKKTTALAVNSGDMKPTSLQTVPAHLVSSGLALANDIRIAKRSESIGQLIRQGHDLDDLLPQIGGVIFQAIGDMGVKTLPDKAGEQRIAHYLLKYYRDLTIAEISLAFELAIVGKLAVDAEHYHSFDTKFVCKILNAYRAQRTIENRKISIQAEKEKQKEPPTSEEIEQVLTDFLQSIDDQFANFQKGREITFHVIHYAYKFLREHRIMIVTEHDWRTCESEAEKQRFRDKSQPEKIAKLASRPHLRHISKPNKKTRFRSQNNS